MTDVGLTAAEVAERVAAELLENGAAKFAPVGGTA